MAKKILNESEQKIIDEVKDVLFKRQLTEGFLNGTFMTADDFSKKLETLKASLMQKHSMKFGNSNS